jgi:hypothetical protein
MRNSKCYPALIRQNGVATNAPHSLHIVHQMLTQRDAKSGKAILEGSNHVGCTCTWFMYTRARTSYLMGGVFTFLC